MFYKYEDIVKLDKIQKDKAQSRSEKNAKILLQGDAAFRRNGRFVVKEFIREITCWWDAWMKDCGLLRQLVAVHRETSKEMDLALKSLGKLLNRPKWAVSRLDFSLS